MTLANSILPALIFPVGELDDSPVFHNRVDATFWTGIPTSEKMELHSHSREGFDSFAATRLVSKQLQR